MAEQRLLVMDDEPDFSDYVRQVGEGLDYDVTVINQSTKFKAAYESVKPTVIVLDIVMPDIDGIELIEWLAEVGNEARVVIVTGYNPHFAEAAKVFAKVKGRFFVTSLTKPVGVADLSAALRSA